MTVIATIWIQKCPILLGDLLISGPEVVGQTLNLPTIGEIETIFPKGSEITSIGLRQKVSILNDNLIVAWSGNQLSARIIISRLLQEARKKEYWHLEDLSSFFADFDGEPDNDVSIVGFSNDSKGLFSFGYGSHVQKHQSDKFGLIRSAGSGENDLLSYLNDFDIPPASRETNPLETAVGNTLSITTYMTGLESSIGSNLLQYYGGGFEIASFIRNKFQKVDDITYLIWSGKQINKSSWELEIPKIATKYFYIDDVLLIRKAEFIPQDIGLAQIQDEALYAVSPIYRDIDNNETTKFKKTKLPSFNSKFICNFIIFSRSDGAFDILNQVNYSNSARNPIRFYDTKSGPDMVVRNDYFESILNKLNKRNKY